MGELRISRHGTSCCGNYKESLDFYVSTDSVFIHHTTAVSSTREGEEEISQRLRGFKV